MLLPRALVPAASLDDRDANVGQLDEYFAATRRCCRAASVSRSRQEPRQPVHREVLVLVRLVGGVCAPLHELIQLGTDRVFTSGRRKLALDGMGQLEADVQFAGWEIEVVAAVTSGAAS